jgi:hypothetical protein
MSTGIGFVHTSLLGEAVPGPILGYHTILSAPRQTQEKMLEYVWSRANQSLYTRSDVEEYVALCYKYGKAVAVDPVVIIAQMDEECGGLGKSTWSEPGKWNFAGIGVTGKPGAGNLFKSLEEGVLAHAGRLARYGTPRGFESPTQMRIMTEALWLRPLDKKFWGCATTWEGLAGTWAADTTYGGKITARVEAFSS